MEEPVSAGPQRMSTAPASRAAHARPVAHRRPRTSRPSKAVEAAVAAGVVAAATATAGVPTGGPPHKASDGPRRPRWGARKQPSSRPKTSGALCGARPGSKRRPRQQRRQQGTSEQSDNRSSGQTDAVAREGEGSVGAPGDVRVQLALTEARAVAAEARVAALEGEIMAVVAAQLEGVGAAPVLLLPGTSKCGTGSSPAMMAAAPASGAAPQLSRAGTPVTPHSPRTPKEVLEAAEQLATAANANVAAARKAAVQQDASVIVQRRMRGTIARTEVQKRVNEKGFLQPMPGTVKGQSGWYGFGDKVLMLRVRDDKSYSRVGDPLTTEKWQELCKCRATREPAPGPFGLCNL